MEKLSFSSHGKFLLTAEYAVLYGAQALTIPLRLGQSMQVTPINEEKLIWKALDDSNETWFSAEFKTNKSLSITKTTDDRSAEFLRNVLRKAIKRNKKQWGKSKGFEVETHLGFNRHWGMGSSSTLISNIGRWLHVDAVQLHFDVSKGSGYDISAAQINLPIRYELFLKREPIVEALNYLPSFADKIYFVYSGKKQKSDKEVFSAKSKKKVFRKNKDKYNDLTQRFINADSATSLQKVIEEHEALTAGILEKEPLKESTFSDFEGAVKSLGAWGGDFFMAVSEKPSSYVKEYFNSKDYSTLFTYPEIALYVK
jgi:mevalonate kinase